MCATFKQLNVCPPGTSGEYFYGRLGNPTRTALETCLASLEKAKYALTFASGLASLTTLSYLLKTGDQILSVDDVYGGSNSFFQNCSSRMGIEIEFVDMLDLNKVRAALKPNTAVSEKL
jgi:cystathionine beta-lyase/cystathionine gamma-synthase